MVKSEYVTYIEEALEQFGNITVRAMFGGYGVYKDRVIFALIIDNELYFKADYIAIQFYKTYGSSPFTYQNKNNKIVTMNYWKVLSDVMEDEEKLAKWFDIAWKVAINSAKKKVK